MVLLTGRGDTTIRIFELGSTCSNLKHCNDMQIVGEPMCGIAMLPKPSCNVANVETMKVLRLTSSYLDPISFVLPRADPLKAYFQDDVFPPARAPVNAVSAADWMNGEDAPEIPPLSLQPEGMTPISQKPPEERKLSKAQETRIKIAEQQQEDKKNEDSFARLAAMANQRAQYHPNESMGRKQGVDAQPIYDSDDGGWSDED